MISSALNLLPTLECVLTLVKIQGQHFGWQPGVRDTLWPCVITESFAQQTQENGVVVRLSLNLENVIL